MKVTKQLRTETGHRLTNYVGRCAHLHGHSYLWEVTALSSELDCKNMVMDFKDLKKAMNTVLDPLDHCMVFAPDDPLLAGRGITAPESQTLKNKGGQRVLCTVLDVLLASTNGDVPRIIIWHDNPTAESFSKWALEKIQEELENLFIANNPVTQGYSMPYFICSVKVWETATSYAEAASGEGS